MSQYKKKQSSYDSPKKEDCDALFQYKLRYRIENQEVQETPTKKDFINIDKFQETTNYNTVGRSKSKYINYDRTQSKLKY